MHIAVITNTSWNIYNFRLSLIKALQERGHEVVAIAPADDYVDKLELEGITCHSININRKGENPFQDFRLLYSYYQVLKKINPDIILTYTIKPNLYVNLAAKRLKLPVISNVSGLGTLFIKKSFSSVIAKMLYRVAFKKATWVFFQNSNDQQLFISKRLVPPEKSSVIPGSGVDLKKFSHHRTQNKAKIFLYTGRIIGDKGIREYIEAAKRIIKDIPDLEFRIIGESEPENKTAILKDELTSWLQNPQIKYMGKTDNIIEELAKVDVVILPSYREGLSKSLIEAAAMNLPIITTDVPGCREVVQHGENGFLCRVKDVNDLYDKIMQMTKLSEQERLEMGKKGRILVEKLFDEEIVISKYLEKINEFRSS
jgi:glycosyltransferase involved in cell wall biosynthesis